MFSNDNNIETIAGLIEEFKKYLSLRGEYLRLSLVEKAVRVLTAVVMVFVMTLLVLLVLTYFSFAAACYLGESIGYPLAFCCVGGFYLLIFVLCVICRSAWIERPLVRLLAKLLME